MRLTQTIRGQCMMLHQKEFEYASQCGIENRAIYILCQVENATSEDPTFKSLLETDAGKKLESLSCCACNFISTHRILFQSQIQINKKRRNEFSVYKSCWQAK